MLSITFEEFIYLQNKYNLEIHVYQTDTIAVNKYITHWFIHSNVICSISEL